MRWAAVLGAAALCFVLKLAGWLVPARLLEHERVRRVAALVPVALLAALVVVQVFAGPTGPAGGQALTVDTRAVGLAAGAVALALRAPFLVVVVVAAATAAALRALG